jgi:CDP-glucose 4,6-dehydratase
MSLFDQFSNKNVVVTGHTGFKGSWLISWLKILGANVVGISLEPSTSPSHFIEAHLHEGMQSHILDIREKTSLVKIINESQPDYLFHLAAQAIVSESYNNPLDTWETNVLGTLNVLEALRYVKKNCAAVMVTSDKCYDNVEWVWGYRETDSLGGHDPYSASKGAAEFAIKSYIKSFLVDGNVKVATARAGNVIGGGDWSKDRIIPDCVRAWSENRIVNLRNPYSTRPWQHVLEPLSGYLTLAVLLSENDRLHGEPFNFGPNIQKNYSVLQLVSQMATHWDMVKWKDVSSLANGPYESALLKLNCDKALSLLNWHAVMGFEDTVNMTADWYKTYYQNSSEILSLTLKQIREYSDIAKKQGLGWAQ